VSASVPEVLDAVVVGAGILGLAVAAELRRRHPEWGIALFEREAEVGRHQTSHNSGVIHAGIYYEPGSLKARLCRDGAERMFAFCAEHDIPHERCGKLIVALDRGELPRLDALERRAHANGVPGIRRLDADELREIEPHATGIAALHSPATGIVDFGAVAVALATQLEQSGVQVQRGCPVRSIVPGGGGGALVEHAHGTTRAGHVVACAGAWSDRLARTSGAPAEPRIVPFRGAYLALRPDARQLVRGLIYPVPDPSLPFLGVHLTRTIAGEVLLGPTALLAGARDAYRLGHVRRRDLRETLAWPGTWRLARRWWRTGLDELRLAGSRRAVARACARYVPAIAADDVVPAFAGIRAQAVDRAGTLLDDFAVSERPGILQVRNAPSPAATASLAVAELIADRVEHA
jgi:2-hydroxyglutarate dehydrogenase